MFTMEDIKFEKEVGVHKNLVELESYMRDMYLLHSHSFLLLKYNYIDYIPSLRKDATKLYDYVNDNILMGKFGNIMIEPSVIKIQPGDPSQALNVFKKLLCHAEKMKLGTGDQVQFRKKCIVKRWRVMWGEMDYLNDVICGKKYRPPKLTNPSALRKNFLSARHSMKALFVLLGNYVGFEETKLSLVQFIRTYPSTSVIAPLIPCSAVDSDSDRLRSGCEKYNAMNLCLYCASPANGMFSPCGHIYLCYSCANERSKDKVTACVMCHTPTEKVVHLQSVDSENSMTLSGPCSSCTSKPACMLFLPCGHIDLCLECCLLTMYKNGFMCTTCNEKCETITKCLTNIHGIPFHFSVNDY